MSQPDDPRTGRPQRHRYSITLIVLALLVVWAGYGIWSYTADDRTHPASPTQPAATATA